MVIRTVNQWGKDEQSEFPIRADGTLADDLIPGDCSTATATGTSKSAHVRGQLPKPRKFIVRVGKVSGSGLLRVWVDGRQQLEKELPCGKGLGKESVCASSGNSGRPPTTRTWPSRFPPGSTAFASTTRARTGLK